MTRLLEGVRVLDLTNVLAGPFCCHQLAHFGAEVIKVEARGRGDLARELGADPELNSLKMGVSFLAQNTGKKSITLDLKNPKGADLLKRLVRRSDVLVENFRPGVMKRLGLSWEDLREVNPGLVYCAISGFGQDGPWSGHPAYDQIIQGVSGLMSITGDDDSAPLRTAFPIADTIGGLTAAFAIAAALNDRGTGAFIDVSMLEALLATAGWVISNWLIAGQRPAAHGNENVTSAPSGTFRAEDRPVNIAANKDEQWHALAGYLGREDLLERPEFRTREDRKENRILLRAEIEKETAKRKAGELVRDLVAIGVPAGEVLDIPSILDHEVIASRGMIASFADVPGAGRDIRVVRTGAKVDGAAPSVEAPPAPLGAHNAEVFGELGLGEDELSRLMEEGVI